MVPMVEPVRDVATDNPDELRTFLLVLRRALLLVCRYIEQRYIPK